MIIIRKSILMGLFFFFFFLSLMSFDYSVCKSTGFWREKKELTDELYWCLIRNKRNKKRQATNNNKIISRAFAFVYSWFNTRISCVGGFNFPSAFTRFKF